MLTLLILFACLGLDAHWVLPHVRQAATTDFFIAN
ncbi:hypothetical protein DFAR_800015 [Desulfarculales bacterium]